MSIQCTAHHGFRYCAEVLDGDEMETGKSHFEGWRRIIWVVMTMIFLVFWFIVL